MACLELEWWAYVSFVFSFFILCLGLNYVVKKINEANIEERFIRMLQKASTTQSTQVNGPLIAVETAKIPQKLSPPDISLVFNQEENRRRTDPYNMILKTAKDWKFEVSSLNAYKSMETINVITIPSDDRTLNDSIFTQKIESERVAGKATSDHILTEKVLVKNNEFGRRAVKETSSITTTISDSYVTELLTVKKNEYGHVSGIYTIPVTRKDCNTSVFVSENETKRIISPKISHSIHIDNVTQDVTAKNSAVRKEPVRIKAEGTTSNEPNDLNDFVADNALTNIYAGRIATNKTKSIVEVTVKKPTLLCDKKSKKEIDSGCSIKKSLDSILSKIANLTNKNEDQRREKSATDTYAVKQSSSFTESSRSINEMSYIEKKESNCIAAKETSSHTKSDREGENVTVKKRESGPIVGRETSLHGRIDRHVKDFFSVKISVAINAAKATPDRTKSDITVSKYFPIKRSDSGSTVARRKDPLQETSQTRSEDNGAESKLVIMSESSRIDVKAKSLTEIVLETSNKNTESDILVINTDDSSVIAEIADTSKTTNDDSVKEIPLSDKIKALIEDENVMELMLCKPSSSSKK